MADSTPKRWQIWFFVCCLFLTVAQIGLALFGYFFLQ
jgi:hypothetical protein